MSAQPEPEQSAPSFPRLHTPPPVQSPAAGGQPPRKRRKNPTLEKVFERYVLPNMQLRGRTKGTIADARLSLAQWRDYWTAQNELALSSGATRISYPWRVLAVRERHLRQWQEHLSRSTGKAGQSLSPATVNRKLGHIRQVLKAAEGKLIKRRPHVQQLATRAAAKYYVPLEQLERIWSACESAHWPRSPGMRPSDWWRCALVLYWTYGFRTQELIAFSRGNVGIDWTSVWVSEETPNPAGVAQSPHGWLTYVPQKQKWAKPEPLYLPLTPTARSAVDRLRRAKPLNTPETRPLFPWPRNQRSFYSAWNRLQEMAGVRNKSGSLYQPKALRRSASTYLSAHYRGLGAAVLGHADREGSVVNDRHYTVDEVTLVEQLASYPAPPCFSDWGTDPQMLLF